MNQDLVLRQSIKRNSFSDTKASSVLTLHESSHNENRSIFRSPKKQADIAYWEGRDSWPSHKPPSKFDDVALFSDLTRTGSILAGFSPNSKLKTKPVTEGSDYPIKCKQISSEHAKRAERSFALTRSQEHIEKALIAESLSGRQYIVATPLPLDAKGVSSANSKKSGLMATTYKQGDRTMVEERVVYIPVSTRRQQPAIADPFYRTASSAIVPGFPNKPYTVGKGLAHSSNSLTTS